ncbi:hypothetical protein FNF29_03301 [Cafeteria roenbergensis]|uniref:Ketoreductase (KR) domain-containing protein n=1 Tax=Cafeteria roenbergensis TaxID=33653 RepID=A0A5A8CJ65_CAFRO|nr:hypothetical protein FNF29_03301 [Cafeteria roenbergensis]|eukprot:KAA0153113.1 hypothetical protein FNF29_03301 [Cafeteria roenbergensis]
MAAVVLGGTGGIGLAIARSLVERGYAVGIASRRAGAVRDAAAQLRDAAAKAWEGRPEGATAAHALLQSGMAPPPVLGIAAEASSKQEVRRVVAETMQAAAAYAEEAVPALQGTQWGGVPCSQMLPLRAAVGCSGMPADGLSMRQSEEEARLGIDSSLMAGLWLTQEAAIAMRRTGGGSVVLVGSAAHLRPRPGQTAYAAAKAGLEGLARSAACELGRFGVRVNVCAPGFIGAGMTLSSLSEAEQLAMAQRSPLRRLGTPADVAAAVEFLASPHDAPLLVRDAGPGASFITGQSLVVDGGLSTSGL